VLNESIEDGLERYLNLGNGAIVDTKLLRHLHESQTKIVPQFWGGPVALPSEFRVAYDYINGDIAFNHTAINHDRKNAMHKDSSVISASFVGYAGWSVGQLESEIRDGDWRVNQVDRRIIADWLSK